jgi:uncharacterized protein YxeA
MANKKIIIGIIILILIIMMCIGIYFMKKTSKKDIIPDKVYAEEDEIYAEDEDVEAEAEEKYY